MFREMFKYGILIIGITILTVLPVSAADRTDVVVSRSNSSVEKNRPITVYIDGVRVENLMPGRRLETRVPNGDHVISAKILTQSAIIHSDKDIISDDYYFTADDTKTLHLRIDVEEKGVLLLKKTIITIALVGD
jgi:hypothetical protein